MYEPPDDTVSRVLNAMEVAGITRDDLVRRGFASRNALHLAFCRRKPLSAALLVKIARALGVDVEDLQPPTSDTGF
jgi:transcriptional regulator with XRE-family HTH domain